MKHVAPLRYGVIFKKAFSDPEIFTAFVQDVLGIKIEIDKVETEKSFTLPIGRVASRFDLFAEDTKNRIIVDIQHVRYEDITTPFCTITALPCWNRLPRRKTTAPRWQSTASSS